MSQVDKSLAKAIVEVAVFLEFSGDEVVDQDSSIQALEQLASTLQGADEETRQSLCSQFADIAKDYSGEQGEFIENLSSALGLIDE